MGNQIENIHLALYGQTKTNIPDADCKKGAEIFCAHHILFCHPVLFDTLMQVAQTVWRLFNYRHG